MIAHARAHPGTVTYGSGGKGSISHIVGESFARAAGVTLTHIPYKGNGPALTDLMAGVLNLAFSDMSGALPFVKSGRLRAVGIAAPARNAYLSLITVMHH